ncbi:MAG TPA: hypothetical protein VGP35_03855 [Terriglobales bacterium]|nr:hypothetical protein [Terriglobales bacterium]
MKKTFLAAVLIAMLVPVALAQNSVPASLGEMIQSRGTSTVMSPNWKPASHPTIPTYCSPCLFYTGDFDSSNSNANGLANESDLLVSDSHIYTAIPFFHPHGASVTGLFVNSLDTVGVEDPASDPWDIRTGVSSGNGGTSVASGNSKSTDTPTGRSGFGLNEYTHLVKFSAVKLTKQGHYWTNVTPQCTNANDSNCDSARYFESDEEDDPNPINHVGTCKNVLDDSFWESTSFGMNWAPTWGSTGGCGGIGCDSFSTGVLGK